METKLINFRAEPAEQAEWIKAAKADNRTLSAWMRDRLNKLARKELAPPKKAA